MASVDSWTATLNTDTRHEFLGTWVDLFTVESFLEFLRESVTSGSGRVIANHNVNSLSLFQRSAAFRQFYDRVDAVFVDGMGVVAAARMVGLPVRSRHRLGVLDWIWPFFEVAEREGWHVVHLGGTDEVLDVAGTIIRRRHPALHLTCINGYFDMTPSSSENDDVLAKLQAERPDVLLVGMGMPRQEIWLLQNLHDLPRCTVITVGGIFGYIGGDRPTAPRWLGRLGLEWLFRLATEPRRLWRRYLVEPVPLVVPIGTATVGRSVRWLRRHLPHTAGESGEAVRSAEPPVNS